MTVVLKITKDSQVILLSHTYFKTYIWHYTHMYNKLLNLKKKNKKITNINNNIYQKYWLVFYILTENSLWDVIVSEFMTGLINHLIELETLSHICQAMDVPFLPVLWLNAVFRLSVVCGLFEAAHYALYKSFYVFPIKRIFTRNNTKFQNLQDYYTSWDKEWAEFEFWDKNEIGLRLLELPIIKQDILYDPVLYTMFSC